jgi:hypothetical protein
LLRLPPPEERTSASHFMSPRPGAPVDLNHAAENGWSYQLR